ncbi:Short-chain dehydrogenase, chloroplastic [Sesamum angolense]|uniref:Short-chain dehydrogenase, chloroplastic n=1 Tax=Sesamum angolense TaxID=2727404 RepID=A0AAE2BRE0_9LAMI|nr:Short-chain dehydrogenase, chloroplastic [Sesamum angolense]
MKATLKYLTGIAGPSGYGSKTTADEVAQDCLSCMPTSHQLTAIVTGATSGIGAETARVLAKRGVRVVIPARDLRKAEKVKESIQRESPEAEIVILEIDLSSFASIQRFCSEFLSLGLPLHILIDAVRENGETASQSCIQGRIVNVSSVIHNWVDRKHFCFSKLLSPKSYNGTRSYAQSKLANILHAKELARQLKARKANVTINAVHPGIVKTGIIRDYRGFITDSLYFMASKLLKSTSQGAATTCYVALSPQTVGLSGKYFADCNESRCLALANEEAEARKLWKQTRALIHRRFLLPVGQNVKGSSTN